MIQLENYVPKEHMHTAYVLYIKPSVLMPNKYVHATLGYRLREIEMAVPIEVGLEVGQAWNVLPTRTKGPLSLQFVSLKTPPSV